MTPTRPRTIEVDPGGRSVPVPRGGLDDRDRMPTGLDEVARAVRLRAIDFFRRLPKTPVDSPIGPTPAPNVNGRISEALAPSVPIPAQTRRRSGQVVTGLTSCTTTIGDVRSVSFGRTEVPAGGARSPRGGQAELGAGALAPHLPAPISMPDPSGGP
jgi:hypothetical protein